MGRVRKSALIVLGTFLVVLPPSAALPPALAAEDATKAGRRVYDFSSPEDCARWTHLTPGAGNAFDGGVAHMSASRGRSFLLNNSEHPRDLAVEVEATGISGPAMAWILLRYKDGDNFYEVVLKKSRVEVWRKDQGRYVSLLRARTITLGKPNEPHVFKAGITGEPAKIDVWLDGKLVWADRDDTGLAPMEGRRVGLETENSAVAVHSVTIGPPGQPAGDFGVGYEEAFADLYAMLGRTYPCFGLKGIDWEAVGDELLPRAKEVSSDEEFGLLCLELVARLEDSHASLLPGSRQLPAVDFPRWDPGFACLIDERDKPVVYHVDPGSPADKAGVRPGMTVESIAGVDALAHLDDIMLNAKKYSGYSSDRYLRYSAARWLSRRMERGEEVPIVLEDTDAKTLSVTLPAALGVRYLPRLPVPIVGVADSADTSWKMLEGNIGYIRVRRIRANLVDDLDRAVGELGDARAVIVDVRGNSGGGFDASRSHRNFAPDDPAEPSRPRFGGPMALLTDEGCISAGEGWASWFVANRRARLFGEATAGASSRKTTYTLKNGFYEVMIPGKAYTGFLKRPIERRGLEPDVPVRQNALDLSQGRDTVLEAARECLLKETALR